MHLPRQFRLTSQDVFAIQRNGTCVQGLGVADSMGRSDQYGEYRLGDGEFAVLHPSGRSPGECRRLDRQGRRDVCFLPE
jgi:hypothetical protein